MVNSIRRGMKRSGVAKNSGCLAFLNPGGRLADLISEILEAQEGSLRVSGSIDALLCALASSASFSQLLPPRRTSRIRGIIFQIPKDALGIPKQLLVRRPPPPCPNMLPPYLHSFIEETINNPFFFWGKSFVFGVSLLENLFSILDILFVSLFRASICFGYISGESFYFLLLYFLSRKKRIFLGICCDVCWNYFSPFFDFWGETKLSFPLFDLILWKRESLFGSKFFLIFSISSLTWILWNDIMVFFLVMIIFFFSSMFLFFCFFKKRYFFSFLFFFPQFYFLFSSFSEKGSLFSFTFLSFCSMFYQCFQEFSKFFRRERRKWSTTRLK